MDGFFAVFEMVVSGLTDDDATKARYLVSRLEGAAQQWLFGQGRASWGYDELKQELRKHFKGESRTY